MSYQEIKSKNVTNKTPRLSKNNQPAENNALKEIDITDLTSNPNGKRFDELSLLNDILDQGIIPSENKNKSSVVCTTNYDEQSVI